MDSLKKWHKKHLSPAKQDSASSSSILSVPVPTLLKPKKGLLGGWRTPRSTSPSHAAPENTHPSGSSSVAPVDGAADPQVLSAPVSTSTQPSHDHDPAQVPEGTAIKAEGDSERSKVRRILNGLKEGLRVVKEVGPVFPPLQAAAGGLLAVMEVFQMHTDNKDEFQRMKTRLTDFRKTVLEDPSRLPDGAIDDLRARLDTQAQMIERTLNEGYLRGLVDARSASGDLMKMIRAVDDAICDFQTRISLDIKNILLYQERREMANWITSTTYDAAYDTAIHLFVSGTGQWFLDDKTFQDWREGQFPLLWCKGDPGVGKTVLSARTIQYLNESKGENAAVVFIYCNDQVQYNLPTMLKSLLHQLVVRSVRSSKMHEIWKAREPLDVEKVKGALKAEIVTYGAVYVIVDALDELTSTVQSTLLQSLQALPIRLLVTSRPSIIRLFDDKWKTIDMSAHHDDIRRYVLKRLEETECDALREAAERLSVVEKVTAKADGMFLMARLHLDELEEKSLCFHDVATTLETLPSSLNDRYNATLGRIKNKWALHILSWIAFSAEPMTLDDLRYALAVPDCKDRMDKDKLIHSDSILPLCVGLVRIQEHYDRRRHRSRIQICTFVHYTVKEHLVKICDRLLSLKQMLSTCIKYLGFLQSIPESRWPPSFTYPAAHSLLVFLRDVEDPSEIDWSFVSNTQLIKLLNTKIGFVDCTNFLPIAAYYNLPQVFNHVVSLSPSLLHDTACTDMVIDYAVKGNNLWVLDELQRRGVSRDHITRATLFFAASHSNQDALRAGLAAPNVDINYRYHWGWTALSNAATQYGSRAEEFLMRLLAVEGLQYDTRDDSGRTPLSYAAECGHTAAVAILLEKGVDASSRDDSGQTPLSYAAERGHTAAVVILLEKGVDASSRDESGRTPLSYAAQHGHTAAVAILLEKGVDASSRDKEGRTPLSHAGCWGGEETIKLLLDTKSVDVNSRDNHGRTPLSHAAQWTRDVNSLRLLLNTLNVDLEDKNNRTPLSYAAAMGNEETVKFLLAIDGVDVNMRDKDGKTPFFYAAASGSKEVVKFMLAVNGVDVSMRDKDGKTPLFYAASGRYGSEEVVKLLLAVDGVDVNMRDKDGKTPLFYAAASGSKEVVELLLAVDGVDVNSRDSNGQTSLSCAARRHFLDTVDALLAAPGIIVDSRSPNGRTPLSFASEQIKLEMFSLTYFRAYLDSGLLDDQIKVVESLLRCSHDNHNRHPGDKDGRTALYYADDNPPVVNLLLSANGVRDVKYTRRRRRSTSYPTRSHNGLLEALIAAHGLVTDKQLLRDARISWSERQSDVFKVAESPF